LKESLDRNKAVSYSNSGCANRNLNRCDHTFLCLHSYVKGLIYSWVVVISPCWGFDWHAIWPIILCHPPFCPAINHHADLLFSFSLISVL